MNKLFIIGLVLCLIVPVAMAAEDQEKMNARRIQFRGSGVAVFLVPNENSETLTSIEQLRLVIGSYPMEVKVRTTVISPESNKIIREYINPMRLGLLWMGSGNEKDRYVLRRVSVENKKITADLYARTTVDTTNEDLVLEDSPLTKVGELELVKTNIQVPVLGGMKDSIARWDGNLTVYNKNYKVYIPIQKTYTVQELSVASGSNCKNSPQSVSCRVLTKKAVNTTIEEYCLANSSDIYCQRAQVEYCFRKHKLTALNADIETADPKCYAVIQQWCGTARGVVANALCIKEQDGTEETYTVDSATVDSALATISETEEDEDAEPLENANTIGQNSPSPLNQGINGAS